MPDGSSHLPPTAADEVTALTASVHGARSASAEWQVLPTLFEQARALTTLGNRPLAVLAASESTQKTEGWTAAQSRLGALSTRSVHQVVDSTHLGLLEDEHGSAAAVTAIDHVIAAVRSHSPRATVVEVASWPSTGTEPGRRSDRQPYHVGRYVPGRGSSSTPRRPVPACLLRPVADSAARS
jgi:hypothetical protein